MDGFSNSNSQPEKENNVEEGFEAEETCTTELAPEKKTETKTAGPVEEKVFHQLFGKRAGSDIEKVFKKSKMEEGNEVAHAAPLEINQHLNKNVEDTKQNAKGLDVANAAPLDVNPELKNLKAKKQKPEKNPEEGEPEPVPVPEPEQKEPEPEPVPVPDPEPEQKEQEPVDTEETP